MDSSNGQQHQEQQLQAHNSLDMLVSSSKSNQQQSAVVDNRKPRPQAEQSLKCPRCDSTNTKFCYYNNYSLTQPRYFCKSCRRYWTKGGTLRNVPVGGGCRKNHKRSSKRSSSQDPHPNPLTPNPSSNPLLLPSFAYDSNDLSAAFARLQRSCSQMGYDDHYINSMLTNSTSTNSHSDILSNCSSPVPSSGFLDALRTGFLETHNGNGFAHNLYYGFGSNNMVDMENGGCGEMGLQPYEELSNNNNVAATTAVTVTKMKQEMSRDIDETNNKVLWGFPWQMNNGDHQSLNMGVGVQHEYESSGRESWNGIVNPSCHGVLPLV